MAITEQIPRFGENAILDARYVSRNTQTLLIESELGKKVMETSRPSESCFDSLNFLLTEWRNGRNTESFQYYLERKKKIHDSLPAISFYSRVDSLANFFKRLSKSTNPENRKKDEISLLTMRINPLHGITEKGTREIYTFLQREILEARKRGVESTRDDLMEAFSTEDIPLLGFSRKTVENMGSIKVTSNGNLELFLPTRIPEVYIKYLYRKSIDYPAPSVVIQPFTQ